MAEDRAVEFVFGEPAEEVGDVFCGDFFRFFESFPFREFGEGGSRGDSGGATVSFPSYIFDFIVFNF